MTVDFHKQFLKEFEKLPKKNQRQFADRLELFLNNPHDPILNNHQLSGKLNFVRSINITGDIRVWYEQTNADTVLFLRIGTHSQLYK